MTGKLPYRIVLADDHPVMRQSIVAYIADYCRTQLKVVAQASDGLEALEAVTKHKPDLVFIDIQMPRMDGLTAVRRMKEIQPDLLALVFSMYEDEAHVVEAIRAGADDYLFKNKATTEQAVGQILRALGGPLPNRNDLHDKLIELIRGADVEKLGYGFARLTGAELAILKRVAYFGESMKEVATRLGGEEERLSENTVRKHLEHIYDKLGARNQAHAVCLAIQMRVISSDGARPDLTLPKHPND
jgi:two-component system nitrate/nitrite response regulator NarL